MPWNAISGIFNSALQIGAQSRENLLTFQRNKNLAAIQNQYNIDQWNRENAYNNPAAQMKRLSDAGLNPNLMYGQGNTGNAGQLSGSLIAGSPAVPNDMSPIGRRASILDSILDSEMKRAQIRNIDADTKNKSSENKILESDGAFRDALNQGSIDLNNVKIKGLSADVVKTEAETTQIREQCKVLQETASKLHEETNKIRSEIALINAKTATEQINQVLNTRRVDAEIDELASRSGKNRAETKRLLRLLPFEIMNINSDMRLDNAQAKSLRELGMKYNAETGILEVERDIKETYQEWNKSLGWFNDVLLWLDQITRLVGNVISIKNGGR